MKWLFREQKPGDFTRDPIIGEFFSTEAIDNPAEALVREGIQNALDAKDPMPGNKVRIRIFLANGISASKSNSAYKWFDDIWDHLNAKGNGLRDVPRISDPYSYLVFEDFGTLGLQGNIHQPFDEPEIENSFFYFFRAEGRSGKSETDRGRWGIGKHVFPRSSRINTYFGFTVRADDKAHLLMGHTILKSHKMNGTNYMPDGFYGYRNSDNALVLPIEDQNILAEFCKGFNLTRDNQPGLSIVVPHLDSEITLHHLKRAVISGYFHPILKDELAVEIEEENKKFRIDARSLLDETNALDEGEKDELIPLVGFADWVVHHSVEKEYMLSPCTLDAPVWSDDLIPTDILENIRNDLDTGKSLAFHIGIQVPDERKKHAMSYFNVYLRQDGFKSGRPIFIRDGITISDVRAPRSPGVRSLVIVEDKPLASLLGDSENPAHTQWQKDSSNFKNKYANGKNYIDFVTKIVSNIVNALSAPEEQKDPYLFADIFSLPLDVFDDESGILSNLPESKEGKKSDVKPLDRINTREKLFQISKINGGFKIIPSNLKIEPQTRLRVLVAYNLRRGNPLSKYYTSDFELDKPPIKYKDSERGINIVEVEKNQILLEVTDSDFQLVVNGFDDRRDLFVKVEEVGGAEDD